MHQSIDRKNKIAIYLIFLLILSTTSSKNLDIQSNFHSSNVKFSVTGLSDENNKQIKNKLDDFFYTNLFFVRKEEINKTISEYNIIEEYNIKRIYPLILNIDIKPTKFIAKISDNNKLLVGANGKLIISEVSEEALPYIFGEFNSKEFLKFKKNIERSQFNLKDFHSIFFYRSNRWDILTINDILIKLPTQKLLESLTLAHKIMNEDQFKDNKLIDLRVSNHVIIQ
jgi:cell division protein FtsQ|tara:strand:+ start:2543 stop:3220 length:678 start_codon:yes stop_codon:yes gene_type:complete